MRKLVIVFMLLLMTGIAAAQVDPFEPVDILTVEVISERPHDPDAFTQGLLLHEDGLLYESTGRYGESTVRAVDPETGEVVRSFALPEQFFAEGLALANGQLFQLTWREGAALVYDLETGEEDGTFEPLGAYQYNQEGWGLCYDGEFLYHSDGSSTMTVRNPENFETVRNYAVTLHGVYVDEINELECVGDEIYANIWNSDTIIRIDKASGIVTGVIDATGLIPLEERLSLGSGAVLNGIAYDAENDVFLITGKLWPTLFEVRFVPVEEE